MSAVTKTDKSHSDLGASSCERWWNCAGSVALIRQYPRAKSSFYAAEGTVAHLVAEGYVRFMLMDDRTMYDALQVGTIVPVIDKAHNAEGELIVIGQQDITVDSEMYDGAIEYLETIELIMDRWNLVPAQVLLEQRIMIPGDASDDEDKFGTADCIIKIPFQKLIVIDYKYGKGKAVTVKDNKQLKYYGLGGLLSLPEDQRADIDIIESVVVQPRLPYGETVTRYEYKREEIEVEFYEALKQKAKECTPDAPRVAGSWCDNNFCPVMAVCPEAKAKAMETAQLDFANVQLPDLVHGDPKYGMLPRPESLSAEQRGNVLAGKKYLEAWLQAVMDYAHAIADQEGIETPGFKLVQKKANRKWQDGAEEKLAAQLGEKAFVRKLNTPSQIEKQFGKPIKALVAELSYTPDNGTTLAPLTDKRKELTISAARDFEGVIIDI